MNLSKIIRNGISVILLMTGGLALASPASMVGTEWGAEQARHLIERAGFGGSPSEIRALSEMGLKQAVNLTVYGPTEARVVLPAFEHSGVFKPTLDPFPPSRPATTKLAKEQGEALGIKVKPSGNRPAQAVVNEFFYWLRASMLETDRVAYWWANRMLATDYPLQEKMALFWHGHFATNEDKVRDYRKMLKQLALFQEKGLGNFRDLLIGVAQDPAMLAFLDAGVNVKGSPNENFAREIMELFTMGVGHYGEEDVREAARAFTGWNFEGLTFHVDPDKHDTEPKTFLGKTANYDGVQIIDRILAEPVTAEFIAGKIYRYFVSEDLSPDLQKTLGAKLKALNYELKPFMVALFSSPDFYQHRGERIKPPVELVVSTYRKLGLNTVPGNPDFNTVTARLGQRLMHPPTVAGWSGGRSWITPGLLFERGNFVLDVVFPDIAFIPPDRYPQRFPQILPVHERLRAGMDITNATAPEGVAAGDMMAASNLVADRDEAFNTRYGNYRGWQMAIEKVKSIPRQTARLDLTGMVMANGAATPREVVGVLSQWFFTEPASTEVQAQLAEYLKEEIGAEDVVAAETYLEEPLRKLLLMMLSQPEYQLH